MPPLRPLALLAPLLLLSGCLGGGGPDLVADCGPTETRTLEGNPFSHSVTPAERDGRTHWVWTFTTGRACAKGTLVVLGAVRVAPPGLAGCPAGDPVAALSTHAASEPGTRDAPSAHLDGGDAVFDLRSTVDMRKVGHATGAIVVLEVGLPTVADPEKARACAMDRIKQVELEASYPAEEA